MLKLNKIMIAIFFISTFSCSSPQENNPVRVNDFIIYRESNSSTINIKIFDLSSKEEYSIVDIKKSMDTEYLLFDKGKKLILLPNYGLDCVWSIYDITTRKSEEFEVNINKDVGEVCSGYDVFSDSILIFVSGSRIILKNIKNKGNFEVIPFEKINLADISVSNKGIIAVNYNSENIEMNRIIPNSYGSLSFINLNNKEVIKDKYSASFIGNWSCDGEKIIIIDNGLIKILNYLTGEMVELTELYDKFESYQTFYFYGNDKLIFCGVETNDEQKQSQIYILDLNSKKLYEKLTSSFSNKEILGIYSPCSD